jgi:hypothetical protein
LHNPAREPLAEPISKLEYEFEKRKLTVDEVRDLIYREVLEYHPQAKREYVTGEAASHFVFPSAIDHFKRQFAHLEAGGAPGVGAGGGGGASRELRRQAQSLPREQMVRASRLAEPGTCVPPSAFPLTRRAAWCSQDQYRHEATKHIARSDSIPTHEPHAAPSANDGVAHGVQAMTLDE